MRFPVVVCQVGIGQRLDGGLKDRDSRLAAPDAFFVALPFELVQASYALMLSPSDGSGSRHCGIHQGIGGLAPVVGVVSSASVRAFERDVECQDRRIFPGG